jgi:hypothetical protein
MILRILFYPFIAIEQTFIRFAHMKFSANISAFILFNAFLYLIIASIILDWNVISYFVSLETSIRACGVWTWLCLNAFPQIPFFATSKTKLLYTEEEMEKRRW